MTLAFSPQIANYNDRRYDVIRTLEEPGGVPHLTVYVDSVGYATIGAGFKVDSHVSEILQGMNLSAVGPLIVQGHEQRRHGTRQSAAVRAPAR